MTPKKPLEDLLAEYTEDLLADRRPRIFEEAVDLDEEGRAELAEMLALVRRLKAAHREAPTPSEDFVQRLDSFVAEETARQAVPESPEVRMRTAAAEEASLRSASLRFRRRILDAGRRFVRTLAPPESGGRWRLAGAVLLVLVLALQVQLYLQVRRLDRQNQALVARLERLKPVGELVPLGQPLERVPQEKGVPASKPRSLGELLSGAELRARIEQRIRELEKEAESKTGRDREIADGVLQELKALLGASRKP